jgi:hypothetical protein
VATIPKLGTKLGSPRNKEIGNMLRKTLYSILFLVAIVVAGRGIVHAAACPQTLTAESWWYETDPPFSGVCQIDIVVVLTNDSGFDLDFPTVGNETFRLWSVPSVINLRPMTTINSAPSGTVAKNETFTYDLTIDTSGLPLTEDRLAFRPYSITEGTMNPGEAPLVNASISCIATAPVGGTAYPIDKVRLLAPWIALAAAIIAAASLVGLRRRRAHS